jgi:hypothetical protein
VRTPGTRTHRLRTLCGHCAAITGLDDKPVTACRLAVLGDMLRTVLLLFAPVWRHGS